MRTAQRGASGVLILVILALIIVALIAMAVLNRTGSALNEREDTLAKLARAAAALDAFAGASGRLPCPARGADNTGVEVPAGGATNCTEAEGTLPWASIGLRREDAFDAWGRKISYRIYDGARGLTQAGGASMVACDTVEPTPGGVVAGNLCNAHADIYRRNTTPAQFLAGKGLTVNDMGLDHTDVAYVLLSFGTTGMGGYSASGVQLDLPKGDEKKNAESGPYTIKAFSDPDTGAGTAAFFDDVIVYRSIPDMVAKAGLAARDWPEGAIFNAATMNTAIGSSAYGDTNRDTFNFMGNTFASFGGSDGDFSFGTANSTEGIGVAGDSNNAMSSNEYIRITLANGGFANHMAITLNDFTSFTVFSQKYREQVQFRFYSNAANASIYALVGTTVVKQSCRSVAGLATFLVEPSIAATPFSRVEVQPMDVTPSLFGFDSFMLISEFAACSGSSCNTTLSSTGNLCTNPTVNAAFAPATVNVNAASVLTFTITNGTDNPAQSGAAFTETFPTGLVVATAPNVQTTCPAGGSTFAAPASPLVVTAPDGSALVAGSTGIKVSGLGMGNNVATCDVRVNVSSPNVGPYTHTAANIGTTANIVDGATSATLTVQ